MDVIEPVDAEKVNEENPTSRFRVLDTAILAPGYCALCRSSGGDGRQFVDFGQQLDFFGAVYFCTWCVGEAAKLLGFAYRNDQIAEAHNEMAERYNELLETSREMENDFRRILRNCHCEPIVSGESFSPVDVETNSESEPDDSDPDESSNVEGFGDVSETSGDDESGESEPAKPARRTRKSAE